MQQAGALQQRSQGGRLGPQFSRLLYHRRAAVWFLILTVAGLAQIASFIVDAIIANSISPGRQRVTIARTDKAFETSNCDTWRKVA